MTACELIQFLAKNVAYFGDMPVCIAYKNGAKFTKSDKLKFTVNSTVDGKSEIVLKEVPEKINKNNMFKYKARIKEIGDNHICEPSYTSPMPVSQEFLIDFWGLENDDVEWYEITEE